MKRIELQETWPESWKTTYPFDLAEIYGEGGTRGHAYAYQNRFRKTLELITEVLPKGARILDIAAAQGNFSLTLAELGYDVTWNDLRAEIAGYVQLKYEHGKIEFVPGNAFEIVFPSCFDGVLITEIIEHVAHPDDFLAKCSSLVRPGGYVFMTTPNGAYFKNKLPKFSECPDPSVYESIQFKPNADGHIFLLHPDEVEVLANRAGLRLDHFILFTNSLTNGHVKTEPLLKVLSKTMVDALEQLTDSLPGPVKEKLLVHMAARFVKLAQ
jgi:2-polyprenyl-3-methyl-5-hydroxy-6-metoxy-1,4-benzoquinol methylase